MSELTNITAKRRQTEALVQKYKWQPIDQSLRPDMCWIDKSRILVDEAYQRGASKQKVLSIAAKFSWAGFGAISCAQRSDGLIFCLDGQHRLLAALKRPEVTTVPEIVYRLSAVSEEASAFLVLNTHRKAMTSIEKFNAQTCARDEIATEINDLIESVGYAVTKGGGPNSVRCLSAMRRCLDENEAVFRECWPVIAILHNSAPIDERVMRAVFILSCRTDCAPIKKPHIDRLKRLGLDAIKEHLRKACHYYANSNDAVLARALAEILNKGLTTNRLRIFDGV